MIFANVGLMALIVGAVASFQASKTTSNIIFFGGVSIAFIMFIFTIQNLIRAGRIAKKLGVEETAEKYDV